MRCPQLLLGCLLAGSAPLTAQTLDTAPRPFQPPASIQPVDGPRIPEPRMEQADIENGVHTLKEIRRRGLEMFTMPFNKHDGMGDGTVDPVDASRFGGRPTANGTWLRMNGLDSQTCQECHSFLSMATVPPTLGIGGVAGIASSAFPFVTEYDVADEDGSGVAEVNGRLINPPFLFGSGGVELAGKEMTMELQDLKAKARANPGTVVPLVAKGIDFGSISFDGTDFDTSRVEGIEEDLVVRPFGRKGEFASVRAFDIEAMIFHFGMQPEEVVGTGVDDDEDGVVDEVKIGELSALHIFNTNLEAPRAVAQGRPDVRRGRETFTDVGCASCHTPALETTTPILTYAFPEVPTDPEANVFYSADLRTHAGLARNTAGGVTVPLFSDLKRHDMGPDLAETTGSHLDPFFITPRLWGIGDTAPYMHDGRALTLRDAILMHGGEGSFAAENFQLLSPAQQDELLIFLDSLRTPRRPAADISTPRRM